MSSVHHRTAAVALLLAALAAAVALAVVGAGHEDLAGGSGRQAVVEQRPAAPEGGTRLGPTDPRAAIDFSLTLRLRDAQLRRFMAQQRDPSSPNYRRFLGPEAFGRRFGPDAADLAAVRRALGSSGIEVTRSYPQRTTLRARGRVEDVSRVFDVSLDDFVNESGARWHSPDRPATVPGPLRRAVRDIAGLDTRPLPLHSAAAPTEGQSRESLEAAYGIRPLHEQGIEGEGETVAIMGYETFSKQDVAQYDELTNTEGPPVEKIRVNGGVNQEGSTEISLDIAAIRAVAPKAQILSYEGPNDGTFSPIVDQIVADGRADIVSLSWGKCDVPEAHAPGQREADLQSFRAAAAQGISVFVASGDSGAYGCQHSNINDDRVAVDFPSASGDLVTVGGTRLSVRENGSYLDEAGWEDVVSSSGGGGGISEIEPRPEFQTGPGVENKLSSGKRQVPDVAAAADGDSGYLIVDGGEVFSVGGTSGAAPFWAASMLLVRQYVAGEGGPEGLGFVNPLLYEIAREEGEKSPFNDVVRGGNRLHNAGPGWDYSTGLGSADMFELAQAFEERLNR